MFGLSGGAVIPVVRLEGVIGRAGGGRGLSAAAVEKALVAAFSVKKAPAVALIINSPGGSPVQSALIGRRIRQLADEKDKHVIVSVEDVAASGGYWLACAGDEIIADAASILGSIGVIRAGFGFPDAIRRLGIERRVQTAGRSKSQLDPFVEEKPEDVARFAMLLEGIHGQFIAHVKDRRGPRLKSHQGMFEGEIYLGAEAVSLGLIDALADLPTLVKARYGEKAKLKPIPLAKPGLLTRLFSQSSSAVVDSALDTLEARAEWARFGV